MQIKTTYKDFIGIYENIIPKEECNLIIEEFENELKNGFEENGLTQFNHQELGRHTFSIFCNENKLFDIYNKINEVLNICIDQYAKEYFTVKQLKATSYEAKLQKIPLKGGFHTWHCEQYEKKVSDRVLVWMVYLNDIPENEGETEFIFQGLRIKPTVGTVVFFPASFTHTHRGNPVYTKEKYIATGWYRLTE
jgi:hypothetical protein